MTGKFLLYSSPFIFLFAAISIFEPWLYQNVFGSAQLHKIKNADFEVIAHKGASGLAPENTISAIQLALDMGVDMIEIDVRHTKDDEIVVFHDERLERTTNGTGFLHDYTLEEIKLLDAGSWFDSRFADEKVPTLKEVLDLVNGRCKVLIEIKHMDHPHYHNFAEKMVNVINGEVDGPKWVILQSYENRYIDEIHELDDHIQTKKLLIGEDSAPLIAFYIETKMHLGRSEKEEQLKALNPHFETLSPRRVFRMHARGYRVYTYPVNDRETMIKVLNMGVDGIITDYPNRLLELREEFRRL